MRKKRPAVTVFLDDDLDEEFGPHLAKYGKGAKRGPYLAHLLRRDIEAHRCGQAAELEADMGRR